MCITDSPNAYLPPVSVRRMGSEDSPSREWADACLGTSTSLQSLEPLRRVLFVLLNTDYGVPFLEIMS